MKMLKRLFRLLGRHREAREPPVFPQPSLDPDEFTRLLCSRRTEDLKTLARKLGQQQPKAHA